MEGGGQRTADQSEVEGSAKKMPNTVRAPSLNALGPPSTAQCDMLSGVCRGRLGAFTTLCHATCSKNGRNKMKA